MPPPLPLQSSPLTSATSPTQTPQILTTIPVNSPPISQQGVSSLTSLFGEIITKNVSSSNLYSLSNSGGNQQQQQSKESSVDVSSSGGGSGGGGTGGGGSGSGTTGGENIIANDIETDKLLNAIEKSKGFSDTYSTQATRRLRNRAIPFQPQPAFNTAYNDRFQAKPAIVTTPAQLDDNHLSSTIKNNLEFLLNNG